MDIIFLKGLKIDTIIGIYDWERTKKQTLILDFELGYDIRKASQTDNIDDTLDYKALTQQVTAFVEPSQFLLVETLAEEICALILKEFNTPWVKLTLNKKGAITTAQDVGIIIERGQK